MTAIPAPVSKKGFSSSPGWVLEGRVVVEPVPGPVELVKGDVEAEGSVVSVPVDPVVGVGSK
jgi:hypothetical protein